MRRTPLKRLGLEKETIKNLNQGDLVQVRGAATTVCESADCEPSFSCEASCTTTFGTCMPA